MKTTLESVMSAFSLPEEEFLHSRTTHAVNARHALFVLLYKQGYTPSQIAAEYLVNRRTIAYAVERFENRLRQIPYLRKTYETLRKELGNV